MEEKVVIPCGDIELEGLFDNKGGGEGVVIAHPHPLYGGDMVNPVVDTIRKVYSGGGFSTLRFNFRGVGASGGRHDNGAGEQKDVLACMDFLKADGIRDIDLGGYSFGAWVMAQLLNNPIGIHRVVMVAPPVAMMDFSDMTATDLVVHAVTGSGDDIAPPRGVEDLVGRLGKAAKLTVIQGADHFYAGYQDKLEAAIGEVIV